MHKGLKTNSGPRSTVAIKRVLKVGAQYTCGVCRKVYADEGQATRCLGQCLHSHLNPSTTVNAEAGGKRFRCHFCKRIHNERGAAEACAAACRSAAQETVAREAKLKKPPPSVNPAETPAAQAAAKAPKVKQLVRRNQEHKYLRAGRKLVCRKCGKEHGNLDAVIGCYDAHPAHVKRVAPPKPEPVVAAPRPQPAAPEPAAPAAPAMPKVVAPGDEHKFSRDGARYLCRNCKKKYFTRDEVGKCFDSHAAA